MKATVFLASALLFAFTMPTRSDDCCESKTITIEQRLQQIDLDIAIKQYEQIQTERAKAEIQLILVQTQIGNDEERNPQIELLRKRRDSLQMAAEEIRHRTLELGKALSVAAK